MFGILCMSSNSYVLKSDLGFFTLSHTTGRRKKASKKDLWGNVSILDCWCLLLRQIDGLLSMALSPSLAHLEGFTTIRDLPNKWKSKAGEAAAIENHPSWQIQWRLPGHSHSPLQMHMARAPHEDSLCVWVCVLRSFQEANLLLFTPCSTTCAPFNLHCCSRSLFQSAVVLIASPWRSQLPLLPEKCCVSLNEENRQDAIDWERERERMRGGGEREQVQDWGGTY